MTGRAARLPVDRIEILHVPDCPLVDRVLHLVRECQSHEGDSRAVDLRVGPYPSPTLLIAGLDITTGEPVDGAPRCRLDLPSRDQILTALRGFI